MKENEEGLLSFNRFMHLFIIITRHSKEQFIKEQRKIQDRRRVAFKLKEWTRYGSIIQEELDIERVKYLDVVNTVLDYFNLSDEVYRASFMKYSMKKESQLRDARHLILRDIDQRMLILTDFNEEIIDRETATKMLRFYEARKLDVLSILSNPFSHQFNQKDKFVLELAVE